MQCLLLCALIVIQITGLKEFSAEERLDFPRVLILRRNAILLSPSPYSYICKCQAAFAWFKLGKVSGVHSKVGGCARTPSRWIPGNSLKEGWVSQMIVTAVRAGFRIVKRDMLGCIAVVVGVQKWVQKGLQFVRNCSAGTGDFHIESKTFRLNRKSQPYARAEFNKFPCRVATFISL